MRGFLILAVIATPVAAQTAPPTARPPLVTGTILDKAINIPGSNWSIYGPGQAARMVKTTGVPGQQAMRVAVAAKGTNRWDVGALSPVQKPIGAGDVVLVAAYLRAPELGDGQTTPVTVSAGEVDAPYRAIGEAPAAVSRDWKLYYASGRAERDYPANGARVSVQLAGAAHVVELGPVFVLDFGPKADPAKLPRN